MLLASKSPRRQELLALLHIPFKIVTIGGLDESYPSDMKPDDVPEYLSQKKASAYSENFHGNELIITADTLVILDDMIMGKPKDKEDAGEMLGLLSGKTHKVVTGVSITTSEKRESFSSVTEVTFAHITKSEIEYYVNTYRPLDKAGAYGIQEWIGGVAVSGIKGSYYNVMGLPIHKLYAHLKKF